LRKTSLISFFTGIFFLLLFTLSVTPKRFLHDALANHKDSEHVVSGDVQEYYSSGFSVMPTTWWWKRLFFLSRVRRPSFLFLSSLSNMPHRYICGLRAP